jgi:hypothetical protein
MTFELHGALFPGLLLQSDNDNHFPMTAAPWAGMQTGMWSLAVDDRSAGVCSCSTRLTLAKCFGTSSAIFTLRSFSPETDITLLHSRSSLAWYISTQLQLTEVTWASAKNSSKQHGEMCRAWPREALQPCLIYYHQRSMLSGVQQIKRSQIRLRMLVTWTSNLTTQQQHRPAGV